MLFNDIQNKKVGSLSMQQKLIVLGPLHFLCYVNDTMISIELDCKLLLYSDKSTILFSHRSLD